ncbi:MAG: hypothetical protein H6Q68_2167 [Firmicutes bacterium]|nr:hypothetical protein [Bacillota bacterium]
MVYTSKPCTVLLLGWLASHVLAGLTDGGIQHLFVLTGLVVLNSFLYRQMRFQTDILWCGIGLTLLFAVVAYFQYINAVALGYCDGMLYGAVGVKHEYYDLSEYYYESKQLADLVVTNAGRDLWMSGSLSNDGTYGPYNAFNVLNTIMMLLYGDNVITLVLLKMNFSVVAIYLLYGIANRFLSPAFAFYSVLAYNLYPGYLVGVTNLLRDNIIATLIIGLAYIITAAWDPPGKLSLVRKIITIILCGILLYFRNYAFGILVVTAAIYYYSNSYRWQKLTILIGLVSISILGFTLGNEIQYVLAELYQEDGPHLWESSAPSSVRMLLRVVYFMFLGQPGKGEDFYLWSVTEWLNFSGFVYLHFFLLMSLVGLYYLISGRLNKGEKTAILVFGYIMPFLFLLLITYIFGWPIPRLYSMWLWITCIVVMIFLESVNDYWKIIWIGSVIAVISAFYFLQYSPFGGILRIGALVQ